MQSSCIALLVCALTVSAIGFVSSAEEFEPKPTKKPIKAFKTDQFHLKTPFSLDDFENPFVPPPVPRNGEGASPWSMFLNPNSRGATAPGELPPKDNKKEGKAEEETEATRAQRFIGATGIDPFFYSNPLTPPPMSRRQSPGYGFNYNYYPYELFMVVQPKLCSNASEGNSTDVAVKFLTGSSSPEPSRCTFAIMSCCAPFNYHIRYPCFEMLGCYNAFWDVNPCAEDVVATAVNEIATFYRSEPAPDNSTAAPADATTTAAAPPPAAES